MADTERTENKKKWEWTEDQKQAITVTDRGVVVSAAAGSGKTAVLIERIIRMLADRSKGISADRLLAVTFTVDATLQMKEKLSAALDKKLMNETDPDRRSWLQKQQDRISLAKISTINSFCLDLVKNNIHRFELQDGLKILDETDARTIRDNAVSKAMDIMAEEAHEELDFLADALYNFGKYTLEDIVSDLYVFLRSLPFPEEWINRCIASLTDDDTIALYTKTAAREFVYKLQRAQKLNERLLGDFYRLNSRYDLGGKAADALNDDAALFKRLIKVSESGSWEDIYREFDSVKWSTLSFAKAPKDKPFDHTEGVEAIKKCRNKYKDNITGIKKYIASAGRDIKADMEKSARVLSLLYKLYGYAEEAAREEKLQRNAIEFADAERMAIQLLVKNENGLLSRTPLAEEIVKNHDYMAILIDEFQDVNNLQELIFKAISDTDDLNRMGKNMFVVGDVKQSIYRFRKSNPQLFINAKNAAADGSGKSRLVELKCNYRSRRNVISFVNTVFENIMSEEIGELVYSGGERLEYAADYQGEDPETEVMLILPDEEADFEAENYSAESLVIARRIRDLIDEKAIVFDPDTEEYRPCRPSDFSVLSRNKKAAFSVSSALETVGLKAYSEESDGYLRSREISVMTDLLRVIDNPMKDIPMAAVMMSPIMGFTADETAAVRRKCVTEKGYTNHLFQVINAAAKSEEQKHEKEAAKLSLNDPALEKKCREAYELIQQLRFYASGMTLSRLIRRIYDETGFFAVASGYENSRQKRANLRMLLEYAASYEQSGNGGIPGFLRYLQSISDRRHDFKQAVTVTSGEDSVIAKTIHASKGLEYPFVFLCGLDKQFNEEDIYKPMLLDEYAGAGFVICDHEKLTKAETISCKALKAVCRSKLLSEELRLLYVALTRAREQLFIPICIKNSKAPGYDTRTIARSLAEEIADAGGINSRIVGSADTYSKWLLSVLMCCPDNEKLLETLGIDCELPQIKTDAGISYTVYEGVRSAAGEAPEFYHGSPDGELTRRLSARFKAEQTISEEGERSAPPSKLTVTELVRDEKEREYGEKDPEFYPQLPKLSAELGKLTSAQRGTYTHLFMELADYSLAEKDAAAELDRLREKGHFTEKEAKGVYISAVKSFFGGEFYSRMKRSSEIIRERQFLVSFSDLDLGEKYAGYMDSGSMLQGVADCLFREEDGYVLVDYKTDNFETLDQPEKYTTQLELYKAALDRLLDMPVKACYIYSFKLNRGIEISLEK